MPYQSGHKVHPDWKCPGPILPCEDGSQIPAYTASKLGPHPVTASDPMASFLYGRGFLGSQWMFMRVKRALEKATITWASGMDVVRCNPAEIVPVSKARRVLL